MPREQRSQPERVPNDQNWNCLSKNIHEFVPVLINYWIREQMEGRINLSYRISSNECIKKEIESDL